MESQGQKKIYYICFDIDNVDSTSHIKISKGKPRLLTDCIRRFSMSKARLLPDTRLEALTAECGKRKNGSPLTSVSSRCRRISKRPADVRSNILRNATGKVLQTLKVSKDRQLLMSDLL